MTPAIYQWATRHGVTHQALAELQTIFGTCVDLPMPPQAKGATGEDAVQSAVRLEAAQKGIKLWRNNVGALKNENGVPIRFGLGNDSATLNKVLKSSDLIGWRKRLITQADVGHIIGQFVARENKHQGWRYTGTDREVAQFNWISIGTADGCDMAFCNGVGSL